MEVRSRYLPWLLLALVVIATAVVRVRLLEVPIERDEGEYAYAGQLILEGVAPYKLVYNMKFPGTYVMYALIMALFGQTPAGIHMGFLILNSLTIVLMFFLGRRLLSESGGGGVVAAAAYGLLSLGPGVYGSQAHATHFVVLFAVAGFICLLRWREGGKPGELLCAGLLGSLAVLMKQQAIVLVAGAIPLMIVARRGLAPRWPARFGLWVAGAAIPATATAVWLWSAGVFDRFWFWTISYAREYATEVPLTQAVSRLSASFPDVARPSAPLWGLAAVGLVALWVSAARLREARLITAFTMLSFAAVCPGFFFRPHYFVLLLPAAALLCAAGVAALREALPSRLPRFAPFALFAVLAGTSILIQRDYLFRTSPRQISRDLYGPNPFVEAPHIAAQLRANTKPGDRIAVLGSEPEIFFLSGRRSATGYIYTYPLVEDQPYALRMQKEMAAEIEASRPQYVVLVRTTTSWLAKPKAPSFIFDWWRDYSRQNYKLAGVVDVLDDETTEYIWDDPGRYVPETESYLVIYRRTD